MTQPEFTEEEMRALEAEMERITVDDVLIQTTVTLLNLAARKAGVATPPGYPNRPEPDWEQVRQAIEGARALMPLLQERHADQLGPVRDTLSSTKARSSSASCGSCARGRLRRSAGSLIVSRSVVSLAPARSGSTSSRFRVVISSSQQSPSLRRATGRMRCGSPLGCSSAT